MPDITTQSTSFSPERVTDTLERIVPDDLAVFREDRYDGGGFGVELGAFTPPDPARLKTVHDRLEEVYRTWLEVRDDDSWAPLAEKCHALMDADFVEVASTLGVSTRASDPPHEVQSVLHDVRGGALTALLLEVQLLEPSPDHDALQTVALLARDHAKMMRNAIVDVAPVLRAEDEQESPHPVDDLLSKWHDQRYGGEGGAEIELHVLTERAVAARCLEASAVDRILYNLVNNATRHTDDGRVGLLARDAGEALIQVVVSNRVGDAQREWLEEQADGDLVPVLFRRGTTRGGRGIGLHNAAAFVAAAFGLAAVDETVDGGYIGAGLVDDEIHVWFHWPAVGRFD